MDITRKKRVESLILNELSVKTRELKDPRISLFSFTRADLTQDGSQVTLYISLIDEKKFEDNKTEDDLIEIKRKTKDCLNGLTSSSGFLRRHLAKILTMKNIPHILFKEDKGLENTVRVHELLKQIAKTNRSE